eukprot:TRINITY_DN75837_c0_g1_i1.p1 TRINITY_DN75837_c0_g1~~TRINITY_DN75837_c0_g1_i1.p1  ORF type:complete len:536 (+),score=60.98 TRINITY_DN75837_c0_g1_i1:47-1654(+)
MARTKAAVPMLVFATWTSIWCGEAAVKSSSASHSVLHPSRFRKVRTMSESRPSLVNFTPGNATLLLKEKQHPVDEASHTTWFERMGNAAWSVVVGLLFVIPFSISLLWVNEQRSARLESVILMGESEAESIRATPENLSIYDGTLIHLNNEWAMGLESIQDARFPGVRMARGCIKLLSVVEVYQWCERVSEEKTKNSVGGGESRTKTYSYNKAWSRQVIDSSSFRHSSGHKNVISLQELPPGVREIVNGTVKYGDHYRLPRNMVNQLNNFQNASSLMGDKLKFGRYAFYLRPDGWYYRLATPDSKPEIGDFRAKIEVVLDGPASILALQVQDFQHDGGRTFSPYRRVSRGCCRRVTEDELKRARIAAARKDTDALFEEGRCCNFFPFTCLCFFCNFILHCFTHSRGLSLVPQIYGAWPGKRDMKQCFDSLKSTGVMAKWGFRMLGWLLLWTGFCMTLAPLEVMLDVVPFLGPYLGSGLSWALALLTMMFTAFLATCIVSVAYLIYHPVLGLLYTFMTLVVFAGFTVISRMLQAKQ